MPGKRAGAVSRPATCSMPPMAPPRSCGRRWLSTQDLAAFVEDLSPNLAVIEKLKAHAFADSVKLLLNWARALQGRTAGRLSLSDAALDESEYVARYRGNPFFSAIHAVTRLQLCYLFEEIGEALESARSRPGTDASPGRHHLAGRVRLLERPHAGGELTSRRRRTSAPAVLAELERARSSLAVLAEHCPENFLCQSLLLGAEIERVSGRSPEAQALYERAIEYAEQSGSLRHQALGNELCARFWRERKQGKVAVAYLDAARRAYGQWGAAAKVADLERRYGGGARDASAAPDSLRTGLDDAGRSEQHRPRHGDEGGTGAGRRDRAGTAAGEAAGHRDRERGRRTGTAGTRARRRDTPGARRGVRGAGSRGPRGESALRHRRAADRGREPRSADAREPGARGCLQRRALPPRSVHAPAASAVGHRGSAGEPGSPARDRIPGEQPRHWGLHPGTARPHPGAGLAGGDRHPERPALFGAQARSGRAQQDGVGAADHQRRHGRAHGPRLLSNGGPARGRDAAEPVRAHRRGGR